MLEMKQVINIALRFSHFTTPFLYWSSHATRNCSPLWDDSCGGCREAASQYMWVHGFPKNLSCWSFAYNHMFSRSDSYNSYQLTSLNEVRSGPTISMRCYDVVCKWCDVTMFISKLLLHYHVPLKEPSGARYIKGLMFRCQASFPKEDCIIIKHSFWFN